MFQLLLFLFLSLCLPPLSLPAYLMSASLFPPLSLDTSVVLDVFLRIYSKLHRFSIAAIPMLQVVEEMRRGRGARGGGGGEAELTGDAEVETPLPVLPSGSFGKTRSLVCVINVRLPLFRKLKVTVVFLVHKCTTMWLCTIKQKYVTWLIIKHFPLWCL